LGAMVGSRHRRVSFWPDFSPEPVRKRETPRLPPGNIVRLIFPRA
jgi:hypothetical protein